MLARTDNLVTTTANWLARFERALTERDDTLRKTLFHSDSHWRDGAALTWPISTANGGNAILSELRKHDRARPASFKIAPTRAAPRQVRRAGIDSLEAIFTFETAAGRGRGVVRLTPDADGNTLRAWTLLTAL